MKSMGAALEAHYAAGATTIARCWKITRRDGGVYGFTDCATDLSVDGLTYDAASGGTTSAIATNSTLAVDNLEIEGVIDSAVITESDIAAGLWDYAAVEVFEVNHQDLTQGALKVRRGWIGEIRKQGAVAFVAELRGLAQALAQSFGYVFAPSCNADLFDARCGLSAGSYTVTGTITSVTSQRQFADSARAEAADYFGGGLITMTSGDNVNVAREVKTFASGLVTTALPFPYDVQIGDAYSMRAGCRKRLSDCRDKFANVVNFRGFPHVPGISRVVSGT